MFDEESYDSNSFSSESFDVLVKVTYNKKTGETTVSSSGGYSLQEVMNYPVHEEIMKVREDKRLMLLKKEDEEIVEIVLALVQMDIL